MDLKARPDRTDTGPMAPYDRHSTVRASVLAGVYLFGGLFCAVLTFGAVRSIPYHPIGGLWATMVFGSFSFVLLRERWRIHRLPREQ